MHYLIRSEPFSRIGNNYPSMSPQIFPSFAAMSSSNSLLSTLTRRQRSVSECSEDNNSVEGSSPTPTLDHRIPITRLPRATSLVEEPESGHAVG